MSLLRIAAADASNPRVDTVVTNRQRGTREVLLGTPTAGATLENLFGRACLREGDEAEAFILVPAGSTRGTRMSVYQWHARRAREALRRLVR